MGKFIIKTATNGQFYFILKAANGQTIITSEMYTRKGGCSSGINSVKKNGVLDGRYELKTSSNGKYYFNLRASNGTVVGSSEMYRSTESRDYGIASVKEQAPNASIVEE